MKKTKQMEELLLEQLRKTPIIETACQKLNISKMTISRWRKQYPKFAARLEDALLEGRLRINDVAESQILALIAAGKFEPSKFWLMHNNARYAAKLEITDKRPDRPLSAEQKSIIRKALRLSSLKSYGKKK